MRSEPDRNRNFLEKTDRLLNAPGDSVTINFVLEDTKSLDHYEQNGGLDNLELKDSWFGRSNAVYHGDRENVFIEPGPGAGYHATVESATQVLQMLEDLPIIDAEYLEPGSDPEVY